jgi:hypothetical protein
MEQIVTISIYVASGEIAEVAKLGSHERAFVYKGMANYDKIIQAETSGDFIARLPNAEEERGEMVVMSEVVRFQIKIY